MPLVPVALALLAGIVAARFTPGLPTGAWVGLTAAAALVGGALLLADHRMRDGVLSMLFLSVVFAAGAIRHHVADPQRDTLDWRHHCPSPAFLELTLRSSPEPGSRSWRSTARVEQVDGLPVRGTLRLYLRRDSTAATLRYGDRLLVHGYADTLRGSLYTTSDHYLVLRHDLTSRRSRIERLRMRLLHRLQNGPLEERHAGVAAALTLGWKASLEPDTRTAYRDAGLSHLLAVSGLHVGLLAAMAGLLLFWTGQDRRGRTLRGTVQLLAVWGFTLLTGLAPPAIRAALMFSLFIVSHILGRRTETFNLLAASAIVTLMADPLLVADTGWQLSYSAVAGILLARPLIRRHAHPLWQSATVSLAATLATLPATLLTFHRFHPWFLLSNVVVVPLAGLALLLALAYVALPCGATAWPLEWLLRLVETFVGGVASLPGAVVATQ